MEIHNGVSEEAMSTCVSAENHNVDECDVSLFRGSCNVMEHALLAQACRVVLAAYALVNHSDFAPDAQRPLSSSSPSAHLWRPRAQDPFPDRSTAASPTRMATSTCSTSRVDHVLSALGIVHEDTPRESRLHDSQVTLSLHRGSAETDVAMSDVKDAVRCLRESPHCAVLTALHLLLCPDHPFRYCHDGDGTLVDAVQTQLTLPRETSAVSVAAVAQRQKANKTAARLLAEYVLSSRDDSPHAFTLSAGDAVPTLTWVDLATRMETFEAPDVWSSAVTASRPTDTSQHRPTVRVHVPAAVERVFPELAHPPREGGADERTSPSEATRIPVDCGCPHMWFRYCVPRWLLDAVQVAHAEALHRGHCLARAFDTWRRRRGERLLTRLARDVDNGVGEAECPWSAAAPVPPPNDTLTHSPSPCHPHAHAQRRPRTRSQCSSISGRSSASVPSLPSRRAGGNGAQNEQAPSAATAAGITGFSPERRASTRSPLREDLIDEARDEEEELDPQSESRTSTVLGTPVGAPPVANGLVDSPEAIAQASRHNAVVLAAASRTDDVEAFCFQRATLLRKAFIHWRDVRFYEHLATRYLQQCDCTVRRRISWERWCRRVRRRSANRKEKNDETRCDVYLAHKAIPVLQGTVRRWYEATVVRQFQWHHVGRRLFAMWCAATKLRRLRAARESRFVQEDGPALVSHCFLVWRATWQRRRADDYCQTRRLRLVWARLRTHFEQSPSSDRLQAFHSSQRHRALHARFHQWQQAKHDRQLEARYAQVHRLRLYRRVILSWQTAAACVQKLRACQAAAASRQAAACLQRWCVRVEARIQRRKERSAQVIHRCRHLFDHWRQRVEWRQKRRLDAEEVADRIAPWIQTRGILRLWFSRMLASRLEKDKATLVRNDQLADAHRRFHLVARGFYRWRAKFVLIARCGMDSRRALSIAASRQRLTQPLVLVSANNVDAYRPLVKAKSTRPRPPSSTATNRGKTTAVTDTPQAAQSGPPRYSPEAMTHTDTTATAAVVSVKSAARTALTAERHFLLAQHVGRTARTRETPLSSTPSVSIPYQPAEVPSTPPKSTPAGTPRSTPVTPTGLSATARISRERPRAAKASSIPSEVSIDARDMSAPSLLRFSSRAPPDGLNESHVSPARDWASHAVTKKTVKASRKIADAYEVVHVRDGSNVRLSARAAGGETNSRHTRVPQWHRGTTQTSPSSRPSFMQPTVASTASATASSSACAVTPEKQTRVRLDERRAHRSGEFWREPVDEGLPTPIAADSQLATSIVSEGLAAWP